MNMEAVVTAVIATAIGALLTAIGAVTKSLHERRDARIAAHRQLELASKRTEFVTGWLNICRSLEGDDSFVADANRRARDELEEAYTEARSALEGERASIAPTVVEPVRTLVSGGWWRTILLLRHWRRLPSKIIVAVFYLFVIILVLSTIAYFVDPNLSESQDVSGSDMAIGSAILSIVFWLICYGLITLIEKTARTPAPAASGAWLPPIAPASDDRLPSRPLRT